MKFQCSLCDENSAAHTARTSGINYKVVTKKHYEKSNGNGIKKKDDKCRHKANDNTHETYVMQMIVQP